MLVPCVPNVTWGKKKSLILHVILLQVVINNISWRKMKTWDADTSRFHKHVYTHIATESSLIMCKWKCVRYLRKSCKVGCLNVLLKIMLTTSSSSSMYFKLKSSCKLNDSVICKQIGKKSYQFQLFINIEIQRWNPKISCKTN